LAYFNDPQEDELLAQQQGAQTTGPQGTATLQGSSGIGSAPAPAQAAPAAPDKGSNFVGINQYLNANKSQAGKLGDQASGVITNSANDARSSVNDLNSAFNQKVGTAATIDQGVLGKVGQAEKLQEPEKQQIKSAYNAQYQGPNSLTDLGDQYNAAGQKLSTAKKNVESAGTEEGRQGLITQINAKPRTQGVTNFDSVLLQAGGGREKLNQAATANKDVAGDVLSQNNLLAQQKASDIKAQTDATRTATQGAVTGANKSLGDSISQRLKEMQTGLTSRNNQITQDLGNDAYSLDADTMADFGLSEGTRSFGLNPMDYWKQGDISQINNSNVANADEYARAQALADLSGGQSYLNQADIGQAGTADKYTSKIDKDKLLADIGAKETEYAKGLKLGLEDFQKSRPQANWGDSLHTTTDAKNLNEMIGNRDSFLRSRGLALPAKPKGNFETATPKELNEKWIPYFTGITKLDNGADVRDLLQYAKAKTAPFKVTSQNTFKANKG
jgi:hypothetical protein